jgi:hypothetical protein
MVKRKEEEEMNLKELWQDKDAVFTLCLMLVMTLGWICYKIINDVVIAWYIEIPVMVVFSYLMAFNIYKQLRLQRLRE